MSVNNAGIRNYGNEAEESTIILTIGQSICVPVNMEVRDDNLCTSLFQLWRQKNDRLKQLCPPREGLQRHVIGLGCLLYHLDIINNHAQTEYFSSTQLIFLKLREDITFCLSSVSNADIEHICSKRIKRNQIKHEKIM